jgi:hypothetical protein
MTHILVMADTSDDHSSAVLLSERVAPESLESARYAAQLLERVRWALQDATDGEDTGSGQPDAGDRPGAAPLERRAPPRR